jgi:hypothetical protein
MITLVSTRTVDHLPLPGGSGVRDLPGGPATYIGDAFRRLGRPFTLITGELADVQVLPAGEGQEYLIPALPPIPLPDRLEGPAAVISPIIGEVRPERVPPADGLLVIDLQGFVRRPGVPTGESAGLFELSGLLQRAQVVKASQSELGRLTPESLAALDGVLLLDTLGARGLILRDGRRQHRISGRPVEAAHTIGAGDTLLAGFVDALLSGHGPGAAARQAMDFTEAVLRERAQV